jgi:hypothetical protein
LIGAVGASGALATKYQGQASRFSLRLFRLEESEMSKPASHPPAEILRAYSLGRLSDGESRLIERHLMNCADCKEHLFEVPATDEFVDWLRKVHTERPVSDPALPNDPAKDDASDQKSP